MRLKSFACLCSTNKNIKCGHEVNACICGRQNGMRLAAATRNVKLIAICPLVFATNFFFLLIINKSTTIIGFVSQQQSITHRKSTDNYLCISYIILKYYWIKYTNYWKHFKTKNKESVFIHTKTIVTEFKIRPLFCIVRSGSRR